MHKLLLEHSVWECLVLKQAGLQADYMLGHSFGELTALWAAGSLTDEAYIQLAISRGEAMSAKHLQRKR